MKIVSAPDLNWKRKYSCYCTAVLEIEASDLKYVADSRDGDFYSFECPCCQQKCTLSAELVPHYIRIKIR